MEKFRNTAFAVRNTRAVQDGEAVLMGEAGNGEGGEGGTVRTEGRALCLRVRGLGLREVGRMGLWGGDGRARWKREGGRCLRGIWGPQEEGKR